MYRFSQVPVRFDLVLITGCFGFGLVSWLFWLGSFDTFDTFDFVSGKGKEVVRCSRPPSDTNSFPRCSPKSPLFSDTFGEVIPERFSGRRHFSFRVVHRDCEKWFLVQVRGVYYGSKDFV